MESIFDEDRFMISQTNKRLVAAINALPEKNAKAMAEAAFTELKKLAVESGQREDEVIFREPNDPRCYFDNRNSYVVAWEAGPFEWGIGASYAIGEHCGKLVEPYYSFDLCFYPAED